MNNKTHKVSNVLLDFIFGEPVSQAEVIEQHTETAWQAWLDAMTARDVAADDGRDEHSFKRPRPMSLMH